MLLLREGPCVRLSELRLKAWSSSSCSDLMKPRLLPLCPYGVTSVILSLLLKQSVRLEILTSDICETEFSPKSTIMPLVVFWSLLGTETMASTWLLSRPWLSEWMPWCICFCYLIDSCSEKH